ncbi:uncharacterized protein LOC131301616 [Rhododendron vialii]|uniref:uncharacterized protein LOC131301616 n=1 Tax=Rhododendron vialii TaxID=182163 RepID=UPI00265FA34E|nr:uncharacterized protein LOC131301616 [Rhododendron vialii]
MNTSMMVFIQLYVILLLGLYNNGLLIVDEFLAKSNVPRRVDFKETTGVIAKVVFKSFLSVTASVTNWDADGTSSSLILEDSPLVDFVELPFQIHFRSILLQHNKRSYRRSCGDGKQLSRTKLFLGTLISCSFLC